MLLILLKLEEDISREIEPSISPPKFFYTHELQKDKKIKVKQIYFIGNFADVFTKFCPH